MITTIASKTIKKLLISTIIFYVGGTQLFGNDLSEPQLVERTEVRAEFRNIATMKFRDRHHGFSVQLPDDWELEEGFSDKYLDFVIVGVSPEEGANDPFIENMNVLVEEIGDEMSIQQYFMWNLAGLMQELPQFQVHEKINVTVNGIPMARIVYSWNLDNKRTVTYQYIFVRGDQGYVLTFSSEPNKFNRLRGMFDAVAKSFEFEEIAKAEK